MKSVLLILISAFSLLPLDASAQSKKLKVFILAGQSNMTGMGSVTTFPAIGLDPKTAPMLKDMQDKDGNPVVCDEVYITMPEKSVGDEGEKIPEKFGKLEVGYGGGKGVRIGPEYTFGIYMHKLLGEPILIIKTAWGGKDLINQFRPPSAGPYPITEEQLAAMKKSGKDVEAAKAKRAEETGFYYRWMMDYVKKVLADPKRVCPVYDPKVGYELAGFAWLQGYNDFIGGKYPYFDPTNGKKSAKDYSEYTRLLGCFIRDIRKESNAPKLPFVVGVFGMDGKTDHVNILGFRKAQAATAELPEFKGNNVINVMLEDFWPEEISRLKEKEAALLKGEIKLEGAAAEALKAYLDQNPTKNGKKSNDADKSSKADKKAAFRNNEELQENFRKACFTPEEQQLFKVGISNQSYHYWGSAKFYGQAGKAFAEEIHKMLQEKPSK